MKKIFSILIPILLLIPICSQAQIRAMMTYTTFMDAEQSPYLETFINIDPHSVKYVKIGEGQYQGIIEITMVFKQKDKIITFSKIDLSTPLEQDTIPKSINIIDIQRIAIPNGEFDFEVSFVDKNNPSSNSVYKDIITINHPAKKLSISGMQFIDKMEKTTKPSIFTKHNFDIYPYISDFFPENVNQMMVYAEIYNTHFAYGDTGEYVYRIFVEDFENSRIVSSLFRMKKENVSPVKIITQSFDISKLPSGNYNLVLEVRNRENKVDAFNKIFFQKSNPSLPQISTDFTTADIANTFVERITSKDTLAYYIDYLYPISTLMERRYALNLLPDNKGNHKNLEDKSADEIKLMMQRYLYNFWHTRDEANPEQAWEKYKLEVSRVNQQFGIKNRPGYQSERGRVYLKYGPPNSINSQTREPSAYPYEIWHYYQIPEQGNVRFVFYNRDLVTNDYELLHSDARGELKDFQWQTKLQKRQNPSNDPDLQRVNPYWGSKVEEYWDRPR